MQIYCKAQKATDRACGVLLEINWVDIFLKHTPVKLDITVFDFEGNN
jgi:hypothetical protein